MPDIRLAIAYDQLSALWEPDEIARRYEMGPPLVDITTEWVAGYFTLARRRDAVRFRSMLERPRASS